MNELIAHPRIIFEVLLAYWAFSAIVTSQPKPKPDSYWANWLYDALHIFAGNVSKFAESKIQTLSQTTVTKVEQIQTEKPQEKP